MAWTAGGDGGGGRKRDGSWVKGQSVKLSLSSLCDGSVVGQFSGDWLRTEAVTRERLNEGTMRLMAGVSPVARGKAIRTAAFGAAVMVVLRRRLN